MLTTKFVVFLLVVYCAGVYKAEDLSVGTAINSELVYTEHVQLSAIPLKIRTKNVFYNNNSTKLIKGIWAIDLDRSEAKVSITSGGVGSSFTNVKIKSQRGERLNYQVQVFV